MNKIRNLLNNLFKKNKKTQDTPPGLDFDKTTDIPNFDTQDEIDLTNSKLSLGEKFDLLKTNLSDKVRRLNRKEISKGGVQNVQNKTLAAFKKKTGSVNWEKLPNNILSSEHHQKTHNYFQLAVIICLVFLLAALVSDLLIGKPTYKALNTGSSINIDDSKLLTKTKINKIKNANVFKTTKVEVVEDTTVRRDMNKKCESADRKSRLPIKLVNTIVLQDSVKSIASVSVRSSSKLESFRVGDKISSLATIGKIGRQKLIVKNLSTGDCEAIEGSLNEKKRGGTQLTVLTPKASNTYKQKLKKVDGIETDGNNFKIKKDFLQEKMKNINDLLTQARGIKIDNPDGSLSFKIVDIEPGSVYDYLGIQNGDVISGIDGEPIRNLNEVMKLFGNVGNLQKMNLTISRNGEETSQSYNIE